MHTPSSYWFIAERHTVTDEVIRTFDAKELFNTRVEFAAVESKKTAVAQPQKESLA